MQEAGYSLAWRTLDAQYVRSDNHPRAVPQRRRRIWLVAYRGEDWRVPVRAIFEPIKALGNEPPQRVVGKGFISPADNSAEENVFDEKKDIEDFIATANPDILDRLLAKGLIDSPQERLKRIEDENNSKGCGDTLFDLFGGALDSGIEDQHQGRGLRESDLVLRLPQSGDITENQYDVYQSALAMSKSVEYCGSMFKAMEEGHEPTVDDLHSKFLENIGNSGFLSKGFVVTMKTPEWNAGVTEEELAGLDESRRSIYDGDVCGLSDILLEDVDPKYFLSWRACWGILNRAGKRGKKLPFELGYALVERIIESAPFVKWNAMYASDAVKKDGAMSDRQIAQTCFDDFVTISEKWDDVKEVQPVKGQVSEEEDSEDCPESDENEPDDE